MLPVFGRGHGELFHELRRDFARAIRVRPVFDSFGTQNRSNAFQRIGIGTSCTPGNFNHLKTNEEMKITNVKMLNYNCKTFKLQV